jgi:hypothetical protein
MLKRNEKCPEFGNLGVIGNLCPGRCGMFVSRKARFRVERRIRQRRKGDMFRQLF